MSPLPYPPLPGSIPVAPATPPYNISLDCQILTLLYRLYV